MEGSLRSSREYICQGLREGGLPFDEKRVHAMNQETANIILVNLNLLFRQRQLRLVCRERSSPLPFL